VEYHRRAAGISSRPAGSEQLLKGFQRNAVLSVATRQVSQHGQGAHAKSGCMPHGREREHLLNPGATFRNRPPEIPETKQAAHLVQSPLRIVRLDPPTQGCAQVVQLTPESINQQVFREEEQARAQKLFGVMPFNKGEEVRGVLFLHDIGFSRRRQALAGVLAHRFQESIALVAVRSFLATTNDLLTRPSNPSVTSATSSPAPKQTASAESNVQPPANTDKRLSSVCSDWLSKA